MSRGEGLEGIARPFILAVMAACVAAALADGIHLVLPDWSGGLFVLACALVVLEAEYSRRLFKTHFPFATDRWRVRLVELLVYMLLLRVAAYLLNPPADVEADLRAMWSNPLRVLDAGTALTVLCAALFWMAANETAQDFERIGEPPPQNERYTPPFESLGERFFWGGVVLLAATAIAHVSRPSGVGPALNALGYFVLGLIVLGQVRLITLRRSWETQSIRLPVDLSQRWLRYSLTFLGLIVVVALLLPTGYSMGLLGSVGTALFLLGTLVMQLLLIPLVLLLWLLQIVSRWLFPKAAWPTPPTAFSAPPVAPGPAWPGWLEFGRSLLFWLVIVGMVAYVFGTYLRDHPELWQALKALAPARWLRDWWQSLRGRMHGLGRALGERFSFSWPSRTARPGAPRRWGFFRLGQSSPREQVLYYYLSLLRRAQERGFPRRPAQTPAEYEPTLEAHLPEVQAETNLLTEAFVEARYSRRPINAENARSTRAQWERIRAALRKIKRKAADNA
jgi:hypothetical protein